MERKRKGYLLRKSASYDNPKTKKQPTTSTSSEDSGLVCLCNKNGSSRTYDLQTQTVTFGEEETAKPKRKVFSRSSILKKFTAEDSDKASKKDRPIMDQDLEFYPVDDHPSPSTFTAWDAFLAGNQAFFREPACMVPDPAFCYMDVIPEEDDDLEALLESDTDDTGSSVSTVIDRFSRTSTANSSFSERCKGSNGEVTFDLEKVLSPFEKLEKELDAHNSKDGDSLHHKEIQRGPIVVITNSSSCEDVHSAGEEDTLLDLESADCSSDSAKSSDHCLDDMFHTPPEINDNNEQSTELELENLSDAPSNDVAAHTRTLESKPLVPTRLKLVNGFKCPDKSITKPKKSEKSSIAANHTTKAKKSYPTPNVPPRMSKHLPARRTRSDPGTSDQPSRIPRPISSVNRSQSGIPGPKTSNKSRSPKLGFPRKLAVIESPKTSGVIPLKKMDSSPEISTNDELNSDVHEQSEMNIDHHQEEYKETSVVACLDVTCEENSTVAVEDSSTNVTSDTNYQSIVLDCISNEVPADPLVTISVNSTVESLDQNTNQKSDKNPFRNSDDSKNPFVRRNNPFDENAEETPALPSKGQMSAAFIAPPIPERTITITAANSEKQNKVIEKSSMSETTFTIATPAITPTPGDKETYETSEITRNMDGCQPPIFSERENNPDDIFSEKEDAKQPSDLPEPLPAEQFWPATEVTKQSEMMSSSSGVSEAHTNPTESPNQELQDKKETVEASHVSSDGEDEQLPHQRPIEDILQALDQLVLSNPPREMEISIDWEAKGPVNIREKTVVPSTASLDGSNDSETEGLTEDRKRCIETLLKEVDECLRKQEVGENTNEDQQSIEETGPPTRERPPLSPGSPDAPTAGSTTQPLHNQHDVDNAINILSEHTSPEMLRHQEQRILADEQRVIFTSAYQEAFGNSADDLYQDPKHHSPGCDDSGVFLEDSIASSPETQSKSAAARLHNSLHNFSEDSSNMKHYSVPEGLDSDAEKSDDLGLASSSIDSADDLDGDPLPSTLKIGSCPPAVPARQKPPPVPARKSLSKSSANQKNSRYFLNEVITLEVPNQNKTPLCKSSSSGEDSNFGEGDIFPNDDYLPSITMRESTKNYLNQHKNEQSRNNFAMTRSFHEETLSNIQRDNNGNQESKSAFLARTLSSSSPVKKLDVPNGNHNIYANKNGDKSAGFKWKSEECLRTAAENKWCLPGRRYEKSVSVKDRIAMFSEMEANQNVDKKDLHRYGSETNIKAAIGLVENKRPELLSESQKHDSLLRDHKWHSMQSIAKKSPEKEIPYESPIIKPALSIPSLAPNSPSENISYNNYTTLPVKIDVDPPKPIISTYPETQLTNNKRYNYGLYSLKNLKNTEDLLSKKAAGSSNLLSIIESRKQPLAKLKGLVIPEKPLQPNNGKELPTIVSSDSESLKDTRRGSLPITVVTASSTTLSLPRNQKLERPPMQKQASLLEPPWKSESKTSNNTLPKYSPAFKKRSLELPGSSLSPTPPSSITSPLSPPPSSPSSICSSNASSTLQQNVFQFSLSHSKPVQPLQPEKPLMSPPSLPSDVEYEGDNSEDSSHSASPMRNGLRNQKDVKVPNLSNNSIQNGKSSNAFTSSVRTVSHQPMMVETLVKPAKNVDYPRAAVCISKTEIHFKSQKSSDSCLPDSGQKKPIGNSSSAYTTQEYPTRKAESSVTEAVPGRTVSATFCLESNKNGTSSTYFSSQSISNFCENQNGTSQVSLESENEVPIGKFRALPLGFQESQARESFAKMNSRQKLENGRPLPLECEDSEDDDSHSTLSHRTEDSRHTTTDDCLSDATTDSFEKPRLPHPEMNNLKNVVDDYASTEGYLSDASTTDVSLRRFSNRPIDYSAEEYFSDATAESPDPEWMSNRNIQNGDSRFRSNLLRTEIPKHSKDAEDSEIVDSDLRPKRLSQQRTVLKASKEPSGSVQKFKALAEKWEQRADVTSPPPPPPVATVVRTNSIAAVILSNNNSTNSVIKGKSNLPPSLMPRNSPDKKSVTMPRVTSRDSSFSVNRSKDTLADDYSAKKPVLNSTSIVSSEKSISGWTHQLTESNQVDASMRRDNLSTSSNSSKTTLKEDNACTAATYHQEISQSKKTEPSPPFLSNGTSTKTNSFTERKMEDSWNNEPRNRRGADFSRSDWSMRPSMGPKASVSDIRRSFENGNQEPEKSTSSKKPQLPAARASTVPISPPVSQPRQSSPVEEDDETTRLVEEAKLQLQQEGIFDHFSVHHVLLKREGLDGGSVGITLAGGADYEVKEITVHKVISGSLADRNGLVLKGDRVMSINGRNLRGVSHGEALHILKAPNPRVLLVLARNSQRLTNGTGQKKQEISSTRDSETFVVQIQKDATGVGFSIEGGKDSPQGDRPLLIKRVFKGGAADKIGQLEEGDEILSINEHPISNMTRTEAWNFLKKLPEGVIRLQLKKTTPLS